MIELIADVVGFPASSSAERLPQRAGLLHRGRCFPKGYSDQRHLAMLAQQVVARCTRRSGPGAQEQRVIRQSKIDSCASGFPLLLVVRAVEPGVTTIRPEATYSPIRPVEEEGIHIAIGIAVQDTT